MEKEGERKGERIGEQEEGKERERERGERETREREREESERERVQERARALLVPLAPPYSHLASPPRRHTPRTSLSLSLGICMHKLTRIRVCARALLRAYTHA